MTIRSWPRSTDRDFSTSSTGKPDSRYEISTMAINATKAAAIEHDYLDE
jgi:hypothetical protein